MVRVLSLDFYPALQPSLNRDEQDTDVGELFSTSPDYKKKVKYLKKIKKSFPVGENIITMVGSRQQAQYLSVFNKVDNILTFTQDIEAATQVLGATLDPFLMADIGGRLKAGESFARAKDTTGQAYSHAQWAYDETRVTVLYAQMHKIANQYPTEKAITFEFFSPDKMVLNSLKEFYEKHRSLIPSNVTLNLKSYKNTFDLIQGTGVIDTTYRQTVRDMWHESIWSPQKQSIEGWRSTFDVSSLQRKAWVKPSKYRSAKLGLFGGVGVGGLATGAHFLAAKTLNSILTAICLSSVNPFLAIAIIAVVTAILIAIAVKLISHWQQHRLEQS